MVTMEQLLKSFELYKDMFVARDQAALKVYARTFFRELQKEAGNGSR